MGSASRTHGSLIDSSEDNDKDLDRLGEILRAAARVPALTPEQLRRSRDRFMAAVVALQMQRKRRRHRRRLFLLAGVGLGLIALVGIAWARQHFL